MAQNPLKNYINNPDAKVVITGRGVSVLDPDLELTGLDIDFTIEKDLEEDPNEAEVVAYNLSDETIGKITEAAALSAPLEIQLLPAGSDLPIYVTAFAGEIDAVTSRMTHPGRETIISCTGQKWNHRAKYIDQKVYSIGTPKALVIADFIRIIGLPVVSGVLPLSSILVSQSFSGPAFPLLRKLCEDVGLYCWIADGILHISSFYVPVNPVPKIILAPWLVGVPEPTDRMDSVDIEKRTITEVVDVNPAQAARRKKTRTGKAQGLTVYDDYTSVDTSIPGVDFTLICQPDINPDDIVTVVGHTDPKWLGKLYRVQSVNHHGDSYGGEWTTELRTDNYEAL